MGRLYDEDNLKLLPRELVTLIGDYTMARTIATVAGGSSPGWRMVDGTGVTAFLCAPACVVAHKDGRRLIVMDYGGQCVRIVHMEPSVTLPNGIPSPWSSDTPSDEALAAMEAAAADTLDLLGGDATDAFSSDAFD